MATTEVYPDSYISDGGATDWGVITGGASGTCSDCDDASPNRYGCINEGCTGYNDDCCLYTEDWIGGIRCGTENPDLEGGVCTSIRVCCRAEAEAGSHNFTVSIWDGASQIGSNKTVTVSSKANYYTSSWTGLSLTEANLTDLAVQVIGTSAEIVYLYEVTVELTYTPAAADNIQINIGDVWKDIADMKINIGDDWKDVTAVQINIGDTWKDVF